MSQKETTIATVADKVVDKTEQIIKIASENAGYIFQAASNIIHLDKKTCCVDLP